MEGEREINSVYLSKNKADNLFSGPKYYENRSSFDVACNMRGGVYDVTLKLLAICAEGCMT